MLTPLNPIPDFAVFSPTPAEGGGLAVQLPLPEVEPVEQAPAFDPLDATLDFDIPFAVDPDEPGEPEKFQAAPAPALDSEQLAGGGHTVDSYRDRNRIPYSHRREGITVCYIKADMSHWVLQGGLTNENWVAWRGGSFSGSSGAVIRGGNANPMNFKPEARFLTK